MHSFYTNAVLQAMALAVVVALICPASGAHYQLDRTSATRETHGRNALERIYRDVEVSQSVHSLCWKRAVENLVEGCKAMDDAERSKFAMQLANCHMERSGLPVHPCTNDMQLIECTRPITNNPIAFNAYTEFLLHSENICYFVQSVYFQEKTERTISALAFTATATLESMEDLQQLSTSMNQMLSHSVQAQGELASSQMALRETIDELKDEQVEGLRSMQTHFGELQLLSGHIQAGVEETIQGQHAIRERQAEFREQQERMHAQGLDFFKHMSSESAFVREQMQHSTEAQTMLLEEQKSILQRVQSIKEFQGQLVESQQEFFEQQQKLHDNTKQQLLEIITDSTTASHHLHQLVQVQTSAFQNAVDNIGELATKSESTIAAIHEQHTKLSSLQNELIGSVEKVAEFQRSILGEFFDMKSIAFYSAFLIATFILTSFSFTGSARWRTVLVVLVNVLIERLLRSYDLPFFPWASADSLIIAARWASLCVAVTVLFASAVGHKDIAQDNNRLLLAMEERNARILEHLQHQETLWSMQLREITNKHRRGLTPDNE